MVCTPGGAALRTARGVSLTVRRHTPYIGLMRPDTLRGYAATIRTSGGSFFAPAIAAIESARRDAWNEAVAECVKTTSAMESPFDPHSETRQDHGYSRACDDAERVIRSLHREEE